MEGIRSLEVCAQAKRTLRNASIDRLDVIEANNPVFDEPTLGVLVKDTFYFIANSQWGAIDDKGQLAPEEKLKAPIVLKVKLTPA